MSKHQLVPGESLSDYGGSSPRRSLEKGQNTVGSIAVDQECIAEVRMKEISTYCLWLLQYPVPDKYYWAFQQVLQPQLVTEKSSTSHVSLSPKFVLGKSQDNVRQKSRDQESIAEVSIKQEILSNCSWYLHQFHDKNHSAFQEVSSHDYNCLSSKCLLEKEQDSVGSKSDEREPSDEVRLK